MATLMVPTKVGSPIDARGKLRQILRDSALIHGTLSLPRFYDVGNREITQSAFESWFGGELDIRYCDPNPNVVDWVCRITGIYARDWGAVQLVRVLNEHGAPLERVAVGRWWPDAPGLDPFPPDCFATRWKDRAIIGWTNEEGNVGFGMGSGDTPPGSSGCWVIHCQAPSDWVGGLGWSPGVEHKCAVLEFKIGPVNDLPPEPPANIGQAYQLLDQSLNAQGLKLANVTVKEA